MENANEAKSWFVNKLTEARELITQVGEQAEDQTSWPQSDKAYVAVLADDLADEVTVLAEFIDCIEEVE